MRKNEALVRTLCQPFCCYYKPGRNEELLCRGAVIAERLMHAGRRLSLNKQSRKDLGGRAKELMARSLCSECEFREHDCDFAQDRTAQPCGGYVFLIGLLESGEITIEDIKEEKK